MLNSVRDLLREDSRRYGGIDGKLIGDLGRYESLTPFEVWLCENVEMADDESGSTDWGCWFARIGKRIVSTDSQGFWYVSRYATETEAIAEFDRADSDYSDWMGDDDE